MNLVIVGPPGAGKGTQAQVVSGNLGLHHLATGNILRHEVTKGSKIGRAAQNYMDRGALVPDGLIVQMIEPYIRKAARNGGFILDGVPRTMAQLEDIEKLMERAGLSLSAVLNLQVQDGVLVERIVNRQTCPKDHRVYHKQHNPPKTDGVCDDCGTKLVTRKDDTREVVEKRLEVYHKQTEPVIKKYKKLGLVLDVDGARPIEEITKAIQEQLKSLNGK